MLRLAFMQIHMMMGRRGFLPPRFVIQLVPRQRQDDRLKWGRPQAAKAGPPQVGSAGASKKFAPRRMTEREGKLLGASNAIGPPRK
jgi:hypothetical protein